MFRTPYQNPIAQGTEALPNAMQLPPATRILGIARGTIEEAILFDQFGAALRHFVRAQRQNQATGGLDVVRNTARGDYFDVTYTRIHGQETVTILAKPTFLELVRRRVNEREIIYDTMLDGCIGLAYSNIIGRSQSWTVSLNGVQIHAASTDNLPSVQQSFSHTVGCGPRAFTLPRGYSLPGDDPSILPRTTYLFPQDDPAYQVVMPTPYFGAKDYFAGYLPVITAADMYDPGHVATWQQFPPDATFNFSGVNRLETSVMSSSLIDHVITFDFSTMDVHIEFFSRAQWSFKPGRKGWYKDVNTKPEGSLLFLNCSAVLVSGSFFPNTARSVWMDFDLSADKEQRISYTVDDVQYDTSALYAQFSDENDASFAGFWNEDNPP